jgi:hypothetical protein
MQIFQEIQCQGTYQLIIRKKRSPALQHWHRAKGRLDCHDSCHVKTQGLQIFARASVRGPAYIGRSGRYTCWEIQGSIPEHILTLGGHPPLPSLVSCPDMLRRSTRLQSNAPDCTNLHPPHCCQLTTTERNSWADMPVFRFQSARSFTQTLPSRTRQLMMAAWCMMLTYAI